ncbi:MAG: hypothetical protein F6J92_09815, partial [Symploca sp. SIO1A3]|nr:hypothetical protein [Symploca sp. SIO1A3]
MKKQEFDECKTSDYTSIVAQNSTNVQDDVLTEQSSPDTSTVFRPVYDLNTDDEDGWDDDEIIIVGEIIETGEVITNDSWDDDEVVISDKASETPETHDKDSGLSNISDTSDIAKKLSDVITDVDSKITKLENLSSLPQKLTIAFDTEFTDKKNPELLCITAYIGELEQEIYIDSSEVNDDFDLIGCILEKIGLQSSRVNRKKTQELINKYWKQFFPKGRQSDVEKLKNCGDLPVKIGKLGLNLTDIDLKLNRRKKITISFKKFDIQYVMFFAYADLFKVYGSEVADFLWSTYAKLTQYRTIKKMGSAKTSLFIDGVPCDFNINIFDCRYALPSIPASLDNQVKTYGISTGKVKISEAIKERYGDDVTEQWCKENMDIVKINYPDIFVEYALTDAKLTYLLYMTLESKYKEVGEVLELETEQKLQETCGSNVQGILKALIYKHFGATEKDLIDLIDAILKSGTAKSLSKCESNDFGVKPLIVAGGLLYTRTAKHSMISGRLLDLDESSCYATAISSMSLYLGQPRLITFPNGLPKVSETLKLINNANLTKDSWYLVVKGKLKNAINTLIPSDLNLKDGTIKSDYKSFSFESCLDEYKDTINLYDADKESKPNSYSKILTKEIRAGKLTYATLTALEDLPDEWYQEFMNLDVLALVYFDPKLKCETIAEYSELVESLPDDKYQVTHKAIGLERASITKATKSNAYLVFPMGEYYQKLKKLRAEFKENNDPIQQILKLIINATYGDFASLMLQVNNPVAANWITSCARAAAWRMTNALNGFAPITDGTGFNLNTVPFGKTFHKLLEKYPNYLTEYTDKISNNFSKDWQVKHEFDFNDIFKQHAKKFLGKSDWLVEMFDYALKDEKNEFNFKTYSNTGAGNYVKSGDWGDKQKTRSYHAFSKMTEWFKSVCCDDYTEHFIYVEKELMKLASGSQDAIYIIKDAEDKHYNKKNPIKMTSELAESICEYGVCHPMGFGKNK